nr:nucleotidyl transferase AbiEii/AbiGii toxin family protein [uncultured Sediminibacterium sp.]
MTQFLQLSVEDRKILIAQVSTQLGLTTQAIEKDWWVTLALKALFSLPMREHFIFKGGTSLSKGWKLIERFSEDIDIALSPEAFKMSYETEPSHSYVKRLKRAGCAYTTMIIKEALESQLIQMGVPNNSFRLIAAEVPANRPDKDPQTLFLHFSSLFEPGGYMLDPVKIEIGVRALREPFSSVTIQSILGKENGSPVFEEIPFDVLAVAPRKTFIEKMMLLHEKYLQGIDPVTAERQSRHLYDLYRMTKQGIAEEVIEDQALYQVLLQHRSHYVRLKGIDYAKMQLHQLVFIPPDGHLDFFRNDYNMMREQMMYGDVPDFRKIMNGLSYLKQIIASNMTS